MTIFKYAIGALALIATPAALSAQACTGSPVLPGNGFFQGSVAFTDGAFGYGMSGGGMTGGNVILSAGISRTEYDNTDVGTNNISGTVGVELPDPDFSLCPAAMVGYSWLTGFDGLDADGFTFGGGVGIGKSFGEQLLVTPHGSAALLHVRATASSGGLSGTESDTGGQFAAGVNVGSDRFYAGPSVTITTFEGSDAVLGLEAGFVF